MSISKRNSEGYADPTAYEALSAVSRAGKATARRENRRAKARSTAAGNGEPEVKQESTEEVSECTKP